MYIFSQGSVTSESSVWEKISISDCMLLLGISPLYVFYIINNQLTWHVFSCCSKYRWQRNKCQRDIEIAQDNGNKPQASTATSSVTHNETLSFCNLRISPSDVLMKEAIKALLLRLPKSSYHWKEYLANLLHYL